PHQDEQRGGVDESQNEEQHRMHRILRCNDHDGRGQAHAGEEVEEDRGEDHSSPHRYGASSAIFLAISRSQRSPLASRRSLSKKSSSRVSVANSKLGPSTMASTGQASWQSPQ